MTDHIDKLRIEPISKDHRRAAFDCGEPALNQYLQRHARQNHDNNIARTFVATDSSNRVFGYYCISTAEIAFKNLPAPHAKRLPKYPIPAARIGQFAVDRTAQGKGLAAMLLIDALQRIISVADTMGVNVILVDALNPNAKKFWLHFGFQEFPEHESKLFIPLATVAQLFQRP